MRLPRLLDGNLNEVRRLHPISCSIDEKIVPLSYANMVVRTKDIIPERSWVELYTINGSAGIFRTRAPQEGYGTNAQIQLEHGVSEIGDYLVRDALNEELTCTNAIRKLFTHYRGNMWRFGSCACNDLVTLTADYDNVLETIIAVLEQVTDYVLSYDFSTKPWTLNVVHKETAVTAEGRLSRNVTTATIRRDDKDLCTRVYVRGLPKPAGQENNENAVGFVEADTINTYGVVEREETGGNDLTVEQATRIAQTFLANHKQPKLSVEIDASDFSDITGESLDTIRLGKRFRLAIPKEGRVVDDIITAVSWENVYGNSRSARITLGDERDPAIQFYREQASKAKAAGRGAKKQAKENESFAKQFEKTDEYGAILEQAGMYLDSSGLLVYARDNVNNIGSMFKVQADSISAEITSRKSADETLRSAIQIEADRITAEVSRATTAEGTMNSRITQTADAITAEVTRATSAEGNLGSRITQTADSITAEVTRATTREGELSAAIQINANGISTKVSKNGVISAINQSAESVKISANKIELDGQTIASLLTSEELTVQTLHVTGEADFQEGIVSSSVQVDDELINVADISISGNTMTITYVDGSKATFSKAVSTWLVGGGSGKVNVTALPQNQTKSVNVSIDGQSSIGANGTYTYTVDYENADGDDVSTGATKTVTVNVPNPYPNSVQLLRRQAGQGSTYNGVLYRKESDGTYTALGSSSNYWYTANTNLGSTRVVHY